jgi:predicted O-methyltransferase YrrM
MYPVSSTPTVFVDHEQLAFLLNHLSQPDSKAVIVGFGEYAKHLVNYHADRIAIIYDPRPEMDGITFRGVPVSAPSAPAPGVNLILPAEYDLLYDFLPKVVHLYPQARLAAPPRMHYKPSNDVKVFEQESLYKFLNKECGDAPVTMMSKEKIYFLIELLRYGLTKPGCIVEMGCWQGGSSWYIAKTLKYLNESRKFFMMDLFEDHMMDPTATMCSDEIRRRMSFYEPAEMIQGLIDDPACLAKVTEKQICFAHMDLGPVPGAVEFIWDHLSPGAPLLLDNYGHLLAPPWEFERLIGAKGGRIIRFPWSEQGLAIKPC